MTYNSSGLSAISYANGFTLWHYRTKDLATHVLDRGYFNEAREMFRPGDFIYVNGGIGTDDFAHGQIAVTRNEGGVVRVAAVSNFVTDRSAL